MLHHVGIEAAPGDIGRLAELFELLGFEPVEPPPSLAEFTWLERGGTQVHLMPTESPTVPSRGHVAVVAPRSYFDSASGKNCDLDFDGVVERVRAGGFEIERRGEHWGSPRAKVTAPGGQVIELMEFPPSDASSVS